MANASVDIIELDTSEDDEPVRVVAPRSRPKPQQSAVIDLTLLGSDEEDSIIPNGNSTEPALPPSNHVVDTEPVQRPQPPRPPSVEPSSQSDTPPVKPKTRKKRSLNNPDVNFRIRSLSPRHEPRRTISHAKRASNASARIDDDEDEPAVPVKRPSIIKPGFRALQRLQTGHASTSKSSAPKLSSKSKQKKNDAANTTPKKAKAAPVRAVLNATFESLVPAVRHDPTASRSNQPAEIDQDPIQDDGGSPEVEFYAPPTPPPLTPPAAAEVEVVEAFQINQDYQPYSPTAASRGAGTSSHADWYVNLLPAGWHSLSATAHPYLPPPVLSSPRPSTPTSTSGNPTTDEQQQPRRKPSKRKRNRRIISDDESDSSEPATVKKRKYSLDEDDDLELSKGLDQLMEALAPRPPEAAQADPVVDAPMEDQDLQESDEEVYQLVESTVGGSPGPGLNFWSRKVTESLERGDSPVNFEDNAMEDFGGDDGGDIQMDDGINDFAEQDETIRAPDLPMPEANHDVNDVVPDTDEDSEAEANGPVRYLDRAEQERKALLDEFTEVLDQHPGFTRGYLRPGISPADAPWVILAPFLRRKLELERIKLDQFENGV